MKIGVLITGGTIDKEYNKINGGLIFTESHLLKMLEQARCHVDLTVETVMLKDSLVMGGRDRKAILNKCKSFEEDRIIISHGTDTMIKTAKYLAENVKDKSIVFFGAMIPYSFGNSDALFNFGTAIAAVQLVPNGVYITMNGRVFNWDKVKKNKKQGCFEAIR